MPQNDAVSKALSSAKAELGKAGSFPSLKSGKAAMAGAGGSATASKPSVTPKPAKSVPTLGDELAAKSANVKQYTDSIPKMHEGGTVTADGPYQLKAGEHVLTEPQKKMARKHALMSVGLQSIAKAGEPKKPVKVSKR